MFVLCVISYIEKGAFPVKDAILWDLETIIICYNILKGVFLSPLS